MPIESVRSHQDERATLLTPALLPLFDASFVTSCDLIKEFTERLALEVFRSIGLPAACVGEVSVSEAVARAGLAPSIATVPVGWLLATLARRGCLASSDGGSGELRYRLERPLPELPAGEIRQAQEAMAPGSLPSYAIAELAARHYPAVLRGEVSGEQALFGPEGISAWVKYFSNANPLYAISNEVGAIAAAQALAPGESTILEIGGGLGSGAEALLDRLRAEGRLPQIARYRFTEISPLFLKRAERTLAARFPQVPFAFASLDIDAPLAAAGVAPASCSMIYGVNVLHVARDLGATLAQLRTALRSDGVLVMAECVRPFAGVPLHLEMVFNLLDSFRDAVRVPGWRPNGGFLSPEQWTAAMRANGFEAVELCPDITAIRDHYPNFMVAAIVARRA